MPGLQSQTHAYPLPGTGAALAHLLVEKKRTSADPNSTFQPFLPRAAVDFDEGWRPPRQFMVLSDKLLGTQTVQVQAWHKLHFRKLAALAGTLIEVKFLKADGTPRYKRPMWLFWIGPPTVALSDLVRMYLWRFAIEHLFRFLKQHLGLNSNRSPSLVSAQQWIWLCALAYWQLLLIRHQVKVDRPAWYPHKTPQRIPLTPSQVQRSALLFLLELGTPAATPRPAGKGLGRTKNYHPAPRPRYPVIFKSQITPRSLSTSP